MKHIFTKAYSRDFSMIMEEAWYSALSKGFWDRLNIKSPHPESWPNFYYFNRGIIEVWEDKDFIKQVKDAIWQKKDEHKFFKKVLLDYDILVKELKKESLSNEVYIDKLFQAISIFPIFWYGILDNRTEKHLRQKFVDVRDKDTIFESEDKIVRKRILKKFPHLKGIETGIVKEEFLSSTPENSIIKKRLNNFVYVPGEYKKIVALEKFVSKNNLELEIFHKSKEGIVKGVVAQTGNVTGKVRIIRMKKDIEKMKKGEVLVSPMTTPDIFPVMEKACAIVTDEGGILCHAAIISRELGIPCIINTKVASELYKDGDLVEVDAEKGVVRKIK